MWKHALIGALMLPGALPAQELSDAATITFFDKEVYPILKENCFKCHGAKAKLKGKFRITSRQGLLRGGEEGPALNLKEPDKSSVLTLLSYKDEDHEMPPDDNKLPQAQIDILTKWVRMGAPFDPKLEIVGKPGEDEFPTSEINPIIFCNRIAPALHNIPPNPKYINSFAGLILRIKIVPIHLPERKEIIAATLKYVAVRFNPKLSFRLSTY